MTQRLAPVGRLREPLQAPGLVLEPLTRDHADGLWPVLSDPALYRYLDYGPPRSLGDLQELLGRLEACQSPDGQEGWGNWALRRPDGTLVGTAQTTLNPDGSAWVAYLVGTTHQGQGHGRSATAAVIGHLRSVWGCRRLLASVEAANERSAHLLQALGFSPEASPAQRLAWGLTDSEVLWVREHAA